MELNTKETDILKILDDGAKVYMFPMLNNEYFTGAAIQMKVFTSPDEWLIIFDLLCFSEKHGFIHNITAFGNKITDQVRLGDKIIHHVWTKAVPIFDEHEQPRATCNPEDRFDVIDPPYIRFGQDGDITIIQYTEGPASLVFDKDIVDLTPGELLREIAFEHTHYLVLKERQLMEIAGRNNDELTLLLELEQWQHPDIADDELPSSIPCFVSLAKAIAARDERLYQCDEDRFNTHWSNWEDLNK